MHNNKRNSVQAPKQEWQTVCLVVGNQYFYGKQRDATKFAAVRVTVLPSKAGWLPRFSFTPGMVTINGRPDADLKLEITTMEDDTDFRFSNHIPQNLLKHFCDLLMAAHSSVEGAVSKTFFAPTIGDAIKHSLQRKGQTPPGPVSQAALDAASFDWSEPNFDPASGD